MKISLDILEPERVLPLARHRGIWQKCVRCDIGRIAHEHVFYRGSIPCDVLFLGLAPGKTEDATGWPFVGKAGRLLDVWISRARGGAGQMRYAVANLVCCRPTDRIGGPNRDPSHQEVLNCKPRLVEFMRDFAAPRAVVTLGKIAREYLPAFQGPRLELKHPAWALRVGAQADLKAGEADAMSRASEGEIVRLRHFLRGIHARV